MIEVTNIRYAWRLIRRRWDNCCKKNDGESSSVLIQIPSAPQPIEPCSLCSPAVAPSVPMNMAPQTDIELALFRVQDNQKQKQFFQQNQLQMHPQQQDVQQQLEALTPGRQQTLANQYLVVKNKTVIADHQ